jgi:hypothetical protein
MSNTRTYTQEITYIRKNGKESKYIVRCVKERKLMDPELKTLKQKIRPLINMMNKEELNNILLYMKQMKKEKESLDNVQTSRSQAE